MEPESTVVNSDQPVPAEAAKPERSELPPLLVDIDTLSRFPPCAGTMPPATCRRR